MTIDRAMALMTSPEAGSVLQLALTGDPAVELPGFRFELDRVHHRPGADVSAIYQIWYDLPSAHSPTEEWLGLTTVEVTEGVATLVHNDLVLRAWRHPADPRLPGLPAACDTDTVGAIAGSLAALSAPDLGACSDWIDAIADWPLLNALVNTASGASWVSIHHGGGVGMGRSIHAGQVTVADGTALAAEKLERVLTNDPGMGVIRHVDAGYEYAARVADERGVRIPMKDRP